MLQNLYKNHGNILGAHNLTFREFVDGMDVYCIVPLWKVSVNKGQ